MHPCLVLRVEVGVAALLAVDPLVLGPVPLLVVRLLVLGLSVVGLLVVVVAVAEGVGVVLVVAVAGVVVVGLAVVGVGLAVVVGPVQLRQARHGNLEHPHPHLLPHPGRWTASCAWTPLEQLASSPASTLFAAHGARCP